MADKSITIQKVVEMLFSGKEYEVASASDGETALSEAQRAAPDVVLVDVDLPRIDGYTLSARLKKDSKLAAVPVILMMSRDDVYDADKGRQAMIGDTIVKPFESQELIGKVKKALSGAAPRSAAAAPPQPAPAPPRPAAPVAPPAAKTPTPSPAPAKPKPAPPADIFDIISEAPTQADLARAAAPEKDESVYEVEPVVEMEEAEETHLRDAATALPTGARAVEEMRAGLGLAGKKAPAAPETIFEEFDLGPEIEHKQAPVAKAPVAPAPVSRSAAPIQEPTLSESEVRRIAEDAVAKMAKEAFAKLQPPTVSDEMLRALVEEKVSALAKDAFSKLPAAQPQALSASDLWSVAEEAVAKIAKEHLAQAAPAGAQPVVNEHILKGLVEEAVSKTLKREMERAPSVGQAPSLPAAELRSIAETTIARMSADLFKNMPLPKISDETVKKGVEDAIWKIAREVAREVIGEVAWEVIPPLAENLIKAEIERLKAET
ncbi:MAG TPA: response regulator [Nitrospirota bacterium]